MNKIAIWHDRILAEALKWRESHPDFRFNLRTGDIEGENRLAQGYWFTGNDRYLFFAPFAPHESNNKTRSIGFVIEFNKAGEPKSTKLEVVFGALRDASLQAVHQKIAAELAMDETGRKQKYFKYYPISDPIPAFQNFLREEYPKLLELIKDSGKAASFLLSEEKFQSMLSNTLIQRERLKTKADTPEPPAPVPPNPGDVDRPVNLIFYGPPGTGKTYWMQQRERLYTDSPDAVTNEAWLHELMARSGWRAVIVAALADLRRAATVPDLKRHPWIQAKARERGRSIDAIQQSLWGYMMEHTPESVATVRLAIRRPPFVFTKDESSRWSLVDDWEELDDDAATLLEELRRGPARASQEFRRYRKVTFHPSYSYEDFIRGIRPVASSEDGTTQFRLVPGVFKKICDDARADPAARYAIFIDEINRANIAKVFGELITLIELDKRVAYNKDGTRQPGIGATTQLPGGVTDDPTEDEFGVPVNLDIYGTMNTADRSIALLDIALRRRFQFHEMEPEYDLLDEDIDGIDVAELLRTINDRLEYLIDRDHRIGHAYFLNLDLDGLRVTFRNQVIPLLQEYFFDDFSKVAKVLSRANGKSAFIERHALNHGTLFRAANTELADDDRWSYRVTAADSWTVADFKGIYEPPDSQGAPTEEDEVGV